MKARVKATGEIIEVHRSTGVLDENSDRIFSWYEVETLDSHSDDYWTRLEHQAAIGAMQGMLNNSLLTTGLLKAGKSHEDFVDEVTRTALRYAHALVEKYKKEERK